MERTCVLCDDNYLEVLLETRNEHSNTILTEIGKYNIQYWNCSNRRHMLTGRELSPQRQNNWLPRPDHVKTTDLIGRGTIAVKESLVELEMQSTGKDVRSRITGEYRQKASTLHWTDIKDKELDKTKP